MKRPRICLRATAGGSGWSSLPGDLLEQISGHLSTDADHLRIHQVCAQWRACTSSPTALRPWILALRTNRSRPPPPARSHSAWLPRGHLLREVDIGAPPAGLPCFLGSARGWLALADDARSPTRLALWDPASGSEVRLPPLAGVIRVFLSADPLASPGWMAVASQRHDETLLLASRPGDAAWGVLCNRPTASVDTLAFHGGRVYYLDWRRVLVVCDHNLGPAAVEMRDISGLVNRICGCPRSHHVRGAHMVSCAGDLLLVILREASGRRHPSSFAEIYKLGPGRWLEIGDRVMDLGDHSLFLARGESLALSAKEFPAIKRNRVYGVAVDGNYYSRSHGRAPPDWAFVFDLGSDTVEEIPCPGELIRDDGSNWQPLFWLCLRGPFKKQQQRLTED
ncbi:hypothetical protein GQ55_2G057500 [Panicum hallii var. hallii]|uniref:Uncharacterized protein n=1 Tax=Panicum hallii var. hallii TaxID=1504633 RepID=A0A2T7ELV2_9POAL|nr:hypothetical protein GQ55_2G057500 [Panicum hallii var. hallii]